MNTMHILVLQLFIVVVGATEIVTPIGKFDLEAKCVDVSIMNKSNVKELPKEIVVNGDGKQVVFLTEGKRMVTIKSGNSTDVKIQNEKDLLSHAVLLNQLFKDLVIDSHDYFYQKSFDKRSERFEMIIKAKKADSGKNGLVLAIRYVEINGKYLYIHSDGFENGDRSTNEDKIQWMGYPDRDPQIRKLFYQEIP